MITYNKKLWKITFFSETVEHLALNMPRGIRVRFLGLLEIMEKHGPDLGMPHTKALGKGLFEIRAKAPEGIGRYFYCTLVNDEIVILHCFVKKTQKTPDRHLKIAVQRMNEVKNENK
jgi:phage-related protein